MFLSIIIPSYNHGQYIEQCLKSILNQKFKHGYEIIVVDKFSSDQTKYIIFKYQKNYKNIFFYKKNYTQAQAINFGFKKAKGLYVAWQNCDDFYSKNVFNYFYKTYKKINDADIIYGNLDLVDKKGIFKRFLFYDNVNFFSLQSEGMLISNQSSISKKNLFPEFNLMDTQNSFDYDFFLRLAYHKKKFAKVLTNKSLASFRIYKEQKSFLYNSNDLLLRKKIINKFSNYYSRLFFYNKIFSKIIRILFMIKKEGFKDSLNYLNQVNINKIF
jgi:glycosyltransferase involved in cell wall biosynthesis